MKPKLPRLRMLEPKHIRAMIMKFEDAYLEGDWEMAHSIEDEIHSLVLRAIAADNLQARVLARLAITTLRRKYPRWSE